MFQGVFSRTRLLYLVIVVFLAFGAGLLGTRMRSGLSPASDSRGPLLHQQIALYDTWYHDYNTQLALLTHGADRAPFIARRAQFTQEYPLFGSYLAWWQSTYRERTHVYSDFVPYLADPVSIDDPVTIAAYLAIH